MPQFYWCPISKLNSEVRSLFKYNLNLILFTNFCIKGDEKLLPGHPMIRGMATTSVEAFLFCSEDLENLFADISDQREIDESLYLKSHFRKRQKCFPSGYKFTNTNENTANTGNEQHSTSRSNSVSTPQINRQNTEVHLSVNPVVGFGGNDLINVTSDNPSIIRTDVISFNEDQMGTELLSLDTSEREMSADQTVPSPDSTGISSRSSHLSTRRLLNSCYVPDQVVPGSVLEE